MNEKKYYELKLNNNEIVVVYDIGDITEDGSLQLSYNYKGNTQTEEIEKLITEKINELLEKVIYGEENA